MRPTRGSSSTSSSTASITLARTEWMWAISTMGTGRGARPGRMAAARSAAATPSSRSGARARKRSSSPAVRGTTGRPPGDSRGQHDRRVLEGLALEQPGEEQVALLPQGQLVVEVEIGVVGQQPAGLELDQGGGDEQELGGDLEVEVSSSAANSVR